MVVWEQPPASRSGRLVDGLIILATTPGQTGRISTYPSRATAHATATALRRKDTARHRPPGEWEFFAGKVDPGAEDYNPAKPYGVWARLVPDTSTDTEGAT